MSLINQDHLFFVQEIREIDVCDNKIYQIIGSDYSKPTDFVRLKYEKHNFKTCENCRKNYFKTLSEIEERFKRFPNCCKQHKNLVKEKWFELKDFATYPKLFTDKLYFTWHHILNFIDTDNWQEEIIDFIEYIFKTFGSFPINYGEPLYFKTFTEQLKFLLKTLKEFKPRTQVILNFIDEYRNPNSRKETDFNILIGIYNDWFKTFPFELSFFAHLKPHFAKNIPLIEKTHTNKYLNLTTASPRSKASLVNTLVDVTDRILSEINTAILYESEKIDDIEKIKLELIVQKRKQKLKEGYNNNSKDPDTRYRKILKEWFKDEVNFIKEIEPSIKRIADKKTTFILIF